MPINYKETSGAFQNELLNLTAFKISTMHKIHVLQMYGWYIFCGISNVHFEIWISYPYIESCVFYSEVKSYEFLHLRAHERF